MINNPPNKINKLLPYLIELRSRLLKCLACFIALFGLCFYYSDFLFNSVAKPILPVLNNQSLVAISVTGPFIVPIELALYSSLLGCMPYFLYHLWHFVVPALYPAEKQRITKVLVTSVLLFYTGLGFAYWVLLPTLFSSITRFIPSSITLLTDASHYMDCVYQLSMAAGLIFQTPLIMWLLSTMKLIEYKSLHRARRYCIICAFVVGMVLTPPDVVSQIILAVPLCLLFEVGLWLVKYQEAKEQRDLQTNTL